MYLPYDLDEKKKKKRHHILLYVNALRTSLLFLLRMRDGPGSVMSVLASAGLKAYDFYFFFQLSFAF